MSDREPVCRAAAAYASSRIVPNETSRLRPLLQGTNPQVRFEAAHALACVGDREAVPVLIGLLADTPTPLAWQAFELLLILAGDKPPATLLPDDPAARRTVRAAWLDWWRANGPRVDLTPLRIDEVRLQGVNVLVEIPAGSTGGKVWECRADGKERWSLTDCLFPIDVHVLPGGRLLIAEAGSQKVTERDRTGKVLWTYPVDSYPTTCQRLSNGNTFIATNKALLEVDPAGKTVSSFVNPTGGSIYGARRLPHGHTLFLSEGGKIVELNRTGQVVRTIDLGLPERQWGGVEPLPNGRFLVHLMSENRVFEVDAAGRRSHEITILRPASAVRLPNGHTLVASCLGRQALEFDAGGREVWQQKTPGLLVSVQRY